MRCECECERAIDRWFFRFFFFSRKKKRCNANFFAFSHRIGIFCVFAFFHRIKKNLLGRGSWSSSISFESLTFPVHYMVCMWTCGGLKLPPECSTKLPVRCHAYLPPKKECSRAMRMQKRELAMWMRKRELAMRMQTSKLAIDRCDAIVFSKLVNAMRMRKWIRIITSPDQ
jgi:hypothetical protein